MSKIIAGVLIIAASVILSGSVTSVYKKRIKFLNDYLEFLSFAEGEIAVYKREMTELIGKFVKDREGEFAIFLRSRFIEKVESSVTDADRKQVEEFVSGMEELDSASQKGFAKICSKRAEKTLHLAEENDRKKGSLIKKLLPLGGAALFLIII